MATFLRLKKRWLRRMLSLVTMAALWTGFYISLADAAVGRSSHARAQADVVALAVALEAYREDQGSYPAGPSGEICQALAGWNEMGKVYFEWSGRADVDGGFLDPWGAPYQILLIEDSAAVESAGRNGLFSDGDDVLEVVRGETEV